MQESSWLRSTNSLHYFIAQQLQYIYKWLHPNHSDTSWLDIEQTLCKDIHITDLPFISRSIIRHPCFKNPAIATTLTAWWKCNKLTNNTISPTEHTPIWNNPDFLINRIPLNFKSWIAKSITHLKHIFHEHKLIQFSDFVQKYAIREHQYLEYVQLK